MLPRISPGVEEVELIDVPLKGRNMWQGGVLAPDGAIYFIPRALPLFHSTSLLCSVFGECDPCGSWYGGSWAGSTIPAVAAGWAEHVLRIDKDGGVSIVDGDPMTGPLALFLVAAHQDVSTTAHIAP